MELTPNRQIRAVYDAERICVYQAYSDDIAESALARGTFVSPPFNMKRMTWIKPSFLWMMYRSGWGLKDDKQKRIFAIDIKRSGFDCLLSNGCFSDQQGSTSKGPSSESAPVRIQWDPERDLLFRRLHHRTIQIGIGHLAVRRFVGEWIVEIKDVTELAHEMYRLVSNGKLDEASSRLPLERHYTVPKNTGERIGIE